MLEREKCSLRLGTQHSGGRFRMELLEVSMSQQWGGEGRDGELRKALKKIVMKGNREMGHLPQAQWSQGRVFEGELQRMCGLMDMILCRV